MALPSDGPLSFLMIAGQLEATAPYSLRNMSSAAGFSTPDSVSEFYGYGPGGGLTLFFVSGPPTNAWEKVCQINPTCCTPVWHSGIGLFPEAGDFVYTDAAGTTPLAGFKGQMYYGMEIVECEHAFNWLLIDDLGSGQVFETGTCTLK